MTRLDLQGKRFGRLVVIGEDTTYPDPHHRHVWCECDCGNTKTISISSLRTGQTRSCGCLRREVAREKATKHGHYFEKLHGVWNTMKQRCNNPSQHDYQWYGARGITVCKEWQAYPAFREWALSNGYREGLTIERVNNNLGYCPENCTWIPLKDQMKNRRSKWRNKTKEV